MMGQVDGEAARAANDGSASVLKDRPLVLGGALMFTPVTIGSMVVPNRIVLPAMTTRYATREGYATERTVAYYRARAAGGVGLVTIEMAASEDAGRHRFNEIGIRDDSFVPGLTRVVDAIHGEGACASIQLGHGGSRVRPAIAGAQPVSASAVPTRVFEIEHETVRPEAMSLERIDAAVEAFVSSALRARAAGFDAVELHASHGYLISQFLSSAENERADEYGGSLENRARFGLRILAEIKTRCPGLSVVYRLTVDDLFPEGLTFQEGLVAAQWAAESGADAISVTVGHYRSLPGPERMIPPMAYPDGTFLRYSAAVKKNVQVPVIGVGRLGDPAVAKMALASQALDLVALGRSLIADPDWPQKVSLNRPVRRCLACNHCIDNMRTGDALNCVVNPMTGHEGQGYKPVVMDKRILVIGAGPAGLSYASVVGSMNDVTVIDQANGPGGAFRWTGRVPWFNDVEASAGSFEAFVTELENECRRQGVNFRYSETISRDSLLLTDVGLIVIATGAAYIAQLGPIVRMILRTGIPHIPVVRVLLRSRRVRSFFYYKFRVPTGQSVLGKLGLGDGAEPEILVIGDASKPGKAREAIRSAFAAGLGLSTSDLS